MSHNLIIGMTESGKTTLAKLVCSEAKKKGVKTAVLDPLHDEWDCDFQTSNQDEFLTYVRSNQKHMLFIDESGTSIGRYNPAMEWLATTSRHLGHSCWFIMQGSAQVMPIIRTNCSKCFLFATDARMTDIIASEFCEPELRAMPTADKLHFRLISRFNPLMEGRVDFDPPGVYTGDAGSAEPAVQGPENVDQSEAGKAPVSNADSSSVSTADDRSS